MEREVYVEALRLLDPSRPAVGGQFVPRPGWDRFDELLLQVQAGTRPRYALHGSVGVGKTSELLSWESRLGSAGVPCAYLEVKRMLPNGLSEWVEIDRIPRSMVPNDAVVLLIDGLDLQHDRALHWFGRGSPLVDPELPALVAVAPHDIARWPADQRAPKLDLMHLLPFPVLSRDARARVDGVHALADTLARRLPPSDLLERPALLRRVALMSGGVPRDAVRILRAAVLSAARRGARVSMEDVVAGERELRQDLEQGFVRDDDEALQWVFRTRRYREADPRLLTMGAVQSYEDHEGAYFLPHPVLFSTVGVGVELATDASALGNPR